MYVLQMLPNPCIGFTFEDNSTGLGTALIASG